MKIIYKDGHVDECPQDQELHVIRHTAAHIMAQAIKRLYPEADFAFGPATENGFYYDVDLGDTKLTDDDLANIEKEMRKICKENLAIKPFILPRDEAVKLMEERQEQRCQAGERQHQRRYRHGQHAQIRHDRGGRLQALSGTRAAFSNLHSLPEKRLLVLSQRKRLGAAAHGHKAP